ncbi:MAG: KaiC domain-containing protein, partial [Candidatus Hydrothermae bacterium]|nr:KaiC domain-containing protein [Candidatus Hydrothermae bacterium]
MDALWTLREALRKAPPLEGVPTGVPRLDHLFYRVDLDTQGTPRRVPLPGYPRGAVIHLAGVADTGKSLMAEQFAVAQAARGEPVVY